MSWMAHLLARGRERYGDRTALIERDRRLTYRELDRSTDSLATALQARGVGHGDRVVVMSHNRIEVLETYFALGKIGAVAVPVHYGHVADEVARVVENCGAQMLIGERNLLPPAGAGRQVLAFDSDEYREATTCAPRGARVAVSDEDPLFILHTSATTGPPKGVVVPHRSLQAMSVAYLADVQPADDCVFLHCGPLSHGAVVIPLAHMAAGATVILTRMFSPPDCLATIRRSGVTHLFAVPEMIRFLLRAGMPIRGRLPSLREIVYAAAPMPRQLLLEAHAEFGCGFRQVYGITEGGGPIATLSPADHDYTPGTTSGPAAVGRSLLGVTIRSFRADGTEPDPGSVGELWVRTPARMLGYWAKPDETAEILRDGWLRTGDLGTVDDRGYVHLTGRAKDVIVRGGQKIFPAEIETVLLGHPAVQEACVVGIPDEDWGEVPLAYVTVAGEEPALVPALRDRLRERLARYKRPVDVLVRADLPRTPIGKIDRRELRRLAAEGQPAKENANR
ncbi:class I adenylate-forming enzyme family protein [Actinoplanes flavus]|uniref:AMP-binding protein n=1 Tax=Actinoplanes flavus TaxID=2820290 RepID=A0ABS3URC7_9ACTN|nr:AMP-binding protein [Actinoplanes flavus]MBO3741340.1 AMP-binding protein [Actinoplanes flavus]